MSEQPTFSLIHTTARLPDGWRAAHDAWLDQCVHPKDVEYVVTVDACDRDKWPGFPPNAGYWGKTVLSVNEKRSCPVDGWNRAAEVSTGKFLITVADDCRPCKRWDEEISKVVPDMSKQVVLDVNYGAKAVPGFLFLSFLTRARYEHMGYVFYPEYWGYKGDDDFTAESQRDGVIVSARHLLFPHLHPSYGLAKLDDVYRRQKKTDQVGQQLFNRRWGARSFLDLIATSNASHIIRARGSQPISRITLPEADRPTCPKCHSPQVSAINGARDQMRCRNCSLNFPASILLADQAGPVRVEARRPSLESLMAIVERLEKRLHQVEKELAQIRCGEPAKGDPQWSESALQN